MTPDDVRQEIELKVVELIKMKLEDGTLTEERAQEMSQMVLDLLVPGMNWETLYKAIPKLDDAFPELSPIVHPLVADYEKRIVKEAQKGVQELIRQGKFDAATKLAKKAVGQDVELAWVGSGSQKQS